MTRFIRSVVQLSLIMLLVVLIDAPALAEGSRSLYPSTYPVGGFRANLDLQPSQKYVGKVIRRTFLYVYVEAGEYLLVGSRNRSNGGDILVYNPQDFGTPGDETIPGSADFTCSSNAQPLGSFGGAGRGVIASRAEELAGPNSADNAATVTNGFSPCAYLAPSTGLYGVLFTVATSGGSGPNGSVATPALSNNSVSAWDVTVRNGATSTADLNGRLFTFAWNAFTGGNSRPVYSTHYYVTNDGYRYAQDLRGLDPNGYALYANTFGFLDNGQPLFKDIRGNEALVTSLPVGVTTQIAQYPSFFSDISSTGANNGEVTKVLTALGLPLAPLTPTVSNVSFSGHVGGSVTTPGVGGTIQFDTTNTISYEIVISRDGVDYDAANTNNRVLTGIAATGTHTVTWDGKDNGGVDFPAQSGAYPFRVRGHNGNIHLPIIDAENNPGQGPTVTRLNGVFNASNASTRAFYDDRGYRTSSGVLVGSLNGTLCSSGSPVGPTSRVNLSGVDSSTNYRNWASGSNANTDCNAAAGWGDAKGLNLWTYFSTADLQSSLLIQDVVIDVATSVTAPNTAVSGSVVQGTFSFANNGNAQANGVSYGMTLSAGLGAVTFGNLPGGVGASYNNATGAVTLTGLPATLNPGESIPYMTFSYTAPATGPVNVNTTIATTDTDGYATNNTASASTGIGATDVLTTVSVPTTATAGATVSGTFTFSNNGSNPATGVTYSASIGSPGNYPASVTFTSLPTGVTAAYNNATGQITFGGTPLPVNLAAGQSFSFGFNYPAPSSGTVPVNTGISTTSSDANAANNNASGTTSIPVSDMAVSLSGFPTAASPGATVTGTLTCTNSGAGPALNASCAAGTGSLSNCIQNPGNIGISAPVSIASLPAGSSVSCTVTVTAPANGTLSISGTTGASNDGNAGNDSATTSTIPVIDAVDDGTASLPSSGGTISLLGNDTSGGSAVAVSGGSANIGLPTIQSAGGLAGLTVNTSGQLVVPSGSAPGSYTVTYQICSAPAASPVACDTASLTVNISAAPNVTLSGTVFRDSNEDKLQGGAESGTHAGGLYVTAVGGSTVAATTAVAADGTYSLSVPSSATYNLVLSTSSNGTTATLPGGWRHTGENANGTPDGSVDGILNVNVGASAVSGQNFGIVLASPPAANNDNAMTTLNTPVTLTAASNDSAGLGTSLDLASLDLDPATPGDQTSITVAGQGTFSFDPLANDGRVLFTPVTGFVGVVTTPYTLRDALGQVSNSANLTVTVVDTAASAKPRANDDSATTPLNTPVTLPAAVNDVPGTGHTLDPSSLRLIDPADSQPKASVSTAEGVWTGNPTPGAVIFTPATGFTGVATLDYTIKDSANEVSDAATLAVTVTGGSAPLATDDSGATQPVTPISVAILANDTPAGGNSLLPGSVDLDPSSAGSQDTTRTTAEGSWIVDAAGLLTFTPTSDYNGSGRAFTGAASLNYTVAGSGNVLSNVAKVTIVVNPAGISTANDSANTQPDTPVNLQPAANDAATPGASLNPSTVDLDPASPGVVDRGPLSTAQGTWEVIDNAGTVRFTPASGFSGTASLPYAISDSLGNTATATMTVTVAAGALPDAVDGATSTPMNTPVSGTVATQGTFPPGASFSLNSNAGHGTVVFNADGTYTYTPADNFSGVDSFTYKVCLPSPNESVCDTATVSITVSGGKANQKPLTVKASRSSIRCGRPVLLSAKGGSGKGGLRYKVKASGQTSCRIIKSGANAYLKIYGKAGSCLVTVTKAADKTHNSITSETIEVKLK